MSTGTQRSAVWKSFEKVEKDKVQCKICTNILSYNGSTGTMLNHLKGKHPTVLSGGLAAQSKFTSFFNQPKKCPPFRAEKITSLVVNMIVKDMLPMNIVESDGFRELINFLEPEYAMPCAKTIKNRICQLYESVKGNLKQKIKEAMAVALTTDCWTSLVTESYLTVTAHFFGASPSWNVQTIVLETRSFPERHTAENLANELLRITNEWSIDKKIVAVVHDNAANINAATTLANFPKVNCAAHSLQLAVNGGLREVNEITKVVAAASKLVGHFKHSTVATQGLVKKQEQMEIKALKLKQKCDTRWNSIYEMFDRLRINRWPITAVLSDRALTKAADGRSLELKESWWNLLEKMCHVLLPLQIATTVFCVEENVSSSIVLPIIRGLQNNHLKIQDGDSKYVADFKMAVTRSLDARFPASERHEKLLLASLLDPRHKHMKFIHDVDREVVKMRLKVLLEEETENDESPKRKRGRTDVGLGLNDVETTDGSVLASRLNGSAMEFLLGSNYSEDGNPDGNDEMENFFNLPSISSSEDPLEWWAENEKRFPALAKIAKKHLLIPATSVPAERIFSKAGLIVNKRRCRLLPGTVDKLVFLNKNL